MAPTIFRNGHSYDVHMSVFFDKHAHPVVNLLFWGRHGTWSQFLMLADTGADYTLMPERDAHALGIPDISQGHAGQVPLGTAGSGSVLAFLHPVVARLPGTTVDVPVLVAFSRQARSRLLGRPDMVKEFVVAFDSQATHFLRD